MKNILFLTFLILASCKSDEVVKSNINPDSYTIEQFYKNIRYSGSSFSPDGKTLLVSNNESGIFNVKSISIETGETTALTSSELDAAFALSYFPSDERFLFSADKGGDEISQIYLQGKDKTITNLTPGEKEKAGFAGWAKDLKRFYYDSNKRDPNFFDRYSMSIEDMSSTLIYENKEGLNMAAMSENEQFLALTKPITTSTNSLFLENKKTGKRIMLSTEDGKNAYSPQFFSADNQYLFYLTDEGSDFQYLAKYDIEKETKTKVFETNWDVWYAYNSWNEKYRVVGINKDGKTEVKLFDIASNSEIKFPDLGGKSVAGVNISRDETQMSMVAASSATPSDIYIYSFKSKEVKRLTNSLNAEITEEHLVEGTVVRFPSFDGMDIPAIYYKPHQASAENKVPALVWVHGGPGGQSRLNFSELIQYLTNHGYAVLAVNNRGSSGYGKAFNQMDDQKHGEVDLQDCVYGKKYLQTLEYVDPDKIGIIGGSYGGYMTMAALTYTPEEFEVGVNIFGVTNWLRTLKSTPPWWASFRDALFQELGDPFTSDSIRLKKISPLFHTEKVTKPLMVLQGANDPRVLQVESDEIVAGVKANGVPVEYVLFPDEGHGFRKVENQIKGYGAVLTFLDKYLKGEEKVAD